MRDELQFVDDRYETGRPIVRGRACEDAVDDDGLILRALVCGGSQHRRGRGSRAPVGRLAICEHTTSVFAARARTFVPDDDKKTCRDSRNRGEIGDMKIKASTTELAPQYAAVCGVAQRDNGGSLI